MPPIFHKRDTSPSDKLGTPPDNLINLARCIGPSIHQEAFTPEELIEGILVPGTEPEEFERYLIEALTLSSKDSEFKILLNDCLSHQVQALSLTDPRSDDIGKRRIQLLASLEAQINESGFNFDTDTSLPLYVINVLCANCKDIFPTYHNENLELKRRHVEGILSGLSALPITTFNETITIALGRGTNGPPSILNWIMTVPSMLSEEYREGFDSSIEAFFSKKKILEWKELEALLEDPVYSLIGKRALTQELQLRMCDPYSYQEPLLERISVFAEHPWANDWVVEFVGEYFTFLSTAFAQTDPETDESTQFARLIEEECRQFGYFIHSMRDREQNEVFEAKISPILKRCALTVTWAEPSREKSFVLTHFYDLEQALGDTWNEIDEKMVSELCETIRCDNLDFERSDLIDSLLDRLRNYALISNWDRFSSSLIMTLNELEALRHSIPSEHIGGVDESTFEIIDFTRWIISDFPRAAQSLKSVGFLNSIPKNDISARSIELEEALLSIEALLSVTPNHEGIFSDEEADKFCTKAAFETFVYVFEKAPLSSELLEGEVSALDHATRDQRKEYFHPDFANCMSEALGMLGASRAALSSDYIPRIKAISDKVGELIKKCDEKLYRERFLPSLFGVFMDVGIPLGPEV